MDSTLSRSLIVLLICALVATGLGIAASPAEAQLGRPPADIVFLIDESGSMGDDQADVRANADFIASELAKVVDPRFALVGFGARAANGDPRLISGFTDVGGFSSALGQLRTDGGREPGVLATTYAMNNLSFRFGASACVVLVTDEDSDGGSVATAHGALDSRNATWFGIVRPFVGNTATTYGPNAGSLSAHTGGEIFDINDFRQDATEVLDALFAGCIAAAAIPPGAELLGYRPGAGYAADPVNTFTGNFVTTSVDLEAPAGVMGMSWSRTLNSRDGSSGILGLGWSHSLSSSFTVLPDGDAVLDEPDGRLLRLPSDGAGGWTAPATLEATTIPSPGGGAVVAYHNGVAWAYGADGLPTTISDTTGQVVTLQRDGDRRLVQALSSTGYALTFAYSGDRLASVTASDGRTVSYAFDGDGALVAVTRADGAVESYDPDGEGRTATIIDPDDVLVVDNVYDASGRVTSQEVADGTVVAFSYDEATRTTTVTDTTTGAVTTYVHDEEGRVTSITDANGQAVSYSYDAAGNVTQVVDRRGNGTSTTYDGNGNVLQRTTPGGVSEQFTYDVQNRVTSSTDPLGNVTAFTYEGDERIPSQVVQPGGGVVTLEVTDGQVTRIVDPDGVAVDYAFDAVRNLESISNALGQATTYGYDGAGNQTSSTLPSGATTTMAYDELRRLVQVTDPVGATTTFSHTAAGHLASTTDAEGNARQMTYDAAGRLASTTDENGATTTYAYNSVGDVISITAPGGAVTTFAYDALGRRNSITDPVGATTTYAHDADGNLVAETDALGQTTSYTIDERGRLVARTDPLG
ncbi:MAG TPA: DUF6531 domain-containing protein, partial [Euzebya sp.]|nr:DUF6531 domain-containing protein [Euzebya sp.]